MYMCVYMYYISHLYIHILCYRHVYKHVRLQYVDTYVCICIYVYIYVYMFIFIYAYVYICNMYI